MIKMCQEKCYKILKEKQTKLTITDISNITKLSKRVVGENLRRLCMLGMVNRELSPSNKNYSGGVFLFSIKK